MKAVPSLVEILERHTETLQIQLNTSAFGRVVSFDAAANTVDVDFVVRQPMRTREGGTEFVPLPRLPGVPVQYPGVAGACISWPLVEGDPVLVVFLKLDHARWLESGGVVDAELQTMHGFSCVALPLSGREPVSVPATGMQLDAAQIVLGGVAGATAVALAALVEARFAKLLTDIGNATIAPNDGGASFQSTLVALLNTPSPDLFTDPVGATKVKAE